MRPGGRTSLTVQGEIFAHMLEHWGLLRPAVLAQDVGGAVTLRAHFPHGCEYARLILANVVAVRPWGSAFFDHVGKHVEAFQRLPPHIHGAIVKVYIKGALVKMLEDDDLEQLIQPWLSQAGSHSFYQQLAQADERYTEEIERAYDKVRCPVHLVWGDRDPWIPLEGGKQLHGLIPRATFETIPDAGQMPQLETLETFLEQLKFLLNAQ